MKEVFFKVIEKNHQVELPKPNEKGVLVYKKDDIFSLDVETEGNRKTGLYLIKEAICCVVPTEEYQEYKENQDKTLVENLKKALSIKEEEENLFTPEGSMNEIQKAKKAKKDSIPLKDEEIIS